MKSSRLQNTPLSVTLRQELAEGDVRGPYAEPDGERKVNDVLTYSIIA